MNILRYVCIVHNLISEGRRGRRRKKVREEGRKTDKDIDIKPRAHVPCDMAMEWPNTRIILDELENQKTWRITCAIGGRLDDLRVTSLPVCIVGDSVPRAHAVGEDVEVVAVEMHRVGDRGAVVEDDADGGGVAEVVDVELWVVGVGNVAEEGVIEERDTAVVLARMFSFSLYFLL